ncbi:unnamed protein product [Soboliphyme baturini]|uniref:DUF632 domain-containing protein n=1 Tax=Soboliphyme baturini TaxID=241478 RepID=A0A183J608_9BILA|nr:unnamed protein product [Soboliphyme baturini]
MANQGETAFSNGRKKNAKSVLRDHKDQLEKWDHLVLQDQKGLLEGQENLVYLERITMKEANQDRQAHQDAMEIQVHRVLREQIAKVVHQDFPVLRGQEDDKECQENRLLARLLKVILERLGHQALLDLKAKWALWEKWVRLARLEWMRSTALAQSVSRNTSLSTTTSNRCFRLQTLAWEWVRQCLCKDIWHRWDRIDSDE